MKPASLKPRLQMFVCVNRRAAGDPLGAGCAEQGDAVYAAAKNAVALRAAYTSVWITRTYCLSQCPKVGASVALYAPQAGTLSGSDTTVSTNLFTEVLPEDVGPMLAKAFP